MLKGSWSDFYNGGYMFNDMVAESVAKATFWILIIFAVGITVRFLLRDIIDFMTENIDKEKKSSEEDL